MKNLGIASILILLFSLVACRPEEEDEATPVVEFVGAAGEPIVLSLAELAADPSAFDGATLQLSGQYGRLPLLVCAEEKQPSPASWGITANAFTALAGGFEAQLRSLVPDGMTITVTGRWQQWQGLVGCGKKATQEKIWYLEVTEIVSPSPLAQVTITRLAGDSAEGIANTGVEVTLTLPPEGAGLPTGEAIPGTTEIPAATPSPSNTPTAPAGSTPSRTAVSRTPTPANGPTSTSTVVVTAVATLTLTPPPTAPPGSSPTATRTPTSTPLSGTTVTPTTGPSTATPTSQAAFPTATPASTEFTEVDKGPIDGEELAGDFLESFQVHDRTFLATAGETISVHVAAAANIDAVIAIVDASSNVLVEHNNAAAGEIEALVNFTLPNDGSYHLQIRSSNGVAGSYAMMMLFSTSYEFVFVDLIEDGETHSVTLNADNDHFWFFQGSQGQEITIDLVPLDSSDLFLELYDPNGDDIAGFVDEGLQGDPEQLANFPLPGAGIYSIRVGEYDFMQGQYEISLSLN